MSGREYPPLAQHWALDPTVIFLNHGSFGAAPRRVLAHRARLQAQLERNPVDFFVHHLAALQGDVQARLAAFLGAPPETVVPVANATAAVNAVLRSLRLEPNDEILVTNHEYNACRNAVDFVAARAGARVRVAALPFPLTGEEAIVAAVLAQAGRRTRLALLDHVTSPTACVLPIARLVAELAARGIDTLVDGAHGPGMLPLDLPALGAAYYAGNCHKWLCAPKSAGFLYVRPDRQAAIRPLAISHGANAPEDGSSRFQQEFAWTGTWDPTAWLSVGVAIETLAEMLPGGWDELRQRNHALACEGRHIVCAALECAPPLPDSLLGSMAAVVVEQGAQSVTPLLAPGEDPLEVALWERERIVVPVIRWPTPPMRLLRISAQLYNSRMQYEQLARALRRLLR